jgi:hypothetical protein
MATLIDIKGEPSTVALNCLEFDRGGMNLREAIFGRRAVREFMLEPETYLLRTSPIALASHHFQHILVDPKFDIYSAPALIVISAAESSYFGNIKNLRDPTPRTAHAAVRKPIDADQGACLPTGQF